jgi:hypothetical protein
MSAPREQARHSPAYIQKRERAAREESERQKHAEYLAALNAIPTQLSADESQDQAADQKRRFREWLTIALLSATVIVAGTADWIFYKTMVEARIATEENTRAWAGPSGAAIDGAVTLNNPASIQLSVVNTGREPARNFVPTIYPGIWDTRSE